MVAGPSLRPTRRLLPIVALTLALFGTAPVVAWGPQAHRVVARIAEAELTATALANVTWLLEGEHLADIATWADAHRSEHPETAPWHFVNIPLQAAGYNRERDCPRTGRATWGDCIVDRIREYRERLANQSSTRAARAEALRFLVHLVADLHQPLHAIGVERGGNAIPVRFFGATRCSPDDVPGTPPCNLHVVWDSALVARRRLSDARYLAALAPRLKQRPAKGIIDAPPETWAAESFAAAKAALVPPQTDIDAAYAGRAIDAIDERLTLGGLRLAALLNGCLTSRARVP